MKENIIFPFKSFVNFFNNLLKVNSHSFKILFFYKNGFKILSSDWLNIKMTNECITISDWTIIYNNIEFQ